MLKVANGVLGALFLVCVALQWNDPDPERWMALYGAAALACLADGRMRGAPVIAGATAAVAVVWAATLVPGVWGEVAPRELFESMQAKGGKVEEARELGGLLIVAVWMLVLLIAARRRSVNQPRAL